MNRSRLPLAIFWLFAGVMHFVRPRTYEAIVPDYAPMTAEQAVRWSGYAELAAGALVIPAATRRFGRWWILGLLTAVFPANIHMAMDPQAVAVRGVPADRMPRWLLFSRLPLQPLAALWAWRATE